MESITGTTLLGVRKNQDGLWIIIQAPTSGMTIDTTAGTYAPGCICINVGSGLTYTNSGTTASPSWQDVNTINTGEIADAGVTPVKTNITYTAAASATGTGPTSTIGDTVTHVTATPATADANSWIVLPTPTVGRKVDIYVSGVTGLELRSSSPTTVGINGGTAANAESALAAGSLNRLLCVSSGNWMGYSYTSAGTAAVLEVAAA